MKRVAFFTYGLLSYAIGMASMVALACFVANVGLPTTLDSPARGPLWQALLINVGLVTLFGVQHSVMARPAFKRWWTRLVPPPVERSTYVLFSALALFALVFAWRPMGGVIWHVESAAARGAVYALYAAGWIGVVVTTFLINHFDLFGLRQVWSQLLGREDRPLRFVTPGPYRVVRHPLYVGWLTVVWAAPTMTAAHLLLAMGLTAYILVAIRFEERDLIESHPEYAAYRRQVPMLIPTWKPSAALRGRPETVQSPVA